MALQPSDFSSWTTLFSWTPLVSLHLSGSDGRWYIIEFYQLEGLLASQRLCAWISRSRQCKSRSDPVVTLLIISISSFSGDPKRWYSSTQSPQCLPAPPEIKPTSSSWPSWSSSSQPLWIHLLLLVYSFFPLQLCSFPRCSSKSPGLCPCYSLHSESYSFCPECFSPKEPTS